MNLKYKTVVLTGGSSGIGYALAAKLADKGCSVFSFDRNEPEEPLEGVAHVSVDVSDGQRVKRAIGGVRSPIDILINNAGVMRRGTIIESSEEDYDLLFDVNVKGSWFMFKYAREHLSPDAMIVQMSSRYALNPAADPGLYALSKLTDMHLAEIFAMTYPEYTVKFLYPGPVDTPLARYGVTGEVLEEKKKIMHTPEFVAEMIIDLIMSDDKTELIYDQETREYVMV